MDPVNQLEFTAKLITDVPADGERFFVITYDLKDKTFVIVEGMSKANIKSRRFLNKTPLSDPKTKVPYTVPSLYIGSQIIASACIFQLVDAPNHTLSYLEAHTNECKFADVDNAFDAVIKACEEASFDLREKFSSYDKKGSGAVNSDIAKSILLSIPGLVGHYAYTISRRFSEGEIFKYEDVLGYMGM